MNKPVATREAYGKALVELGEEYDNIVVLDADLSKSTKTDTFAKAFPDRHINCGIAESNMISTAAGLAAAGMLPFASSFAVFAVGRGYDQIRNSVAYPHLHVVIAASHAGLSVGEDGASHQCIEDIALMRAVPGMTVLVPCDGASTRAAVLASAEHDGPVYLRLGRLAVDAVYQGDELKFEIGKGIKLRDGSDLTIAATGLMVQMALEAAQKLSKEGISARVVDIHTIKPIDGKLLVQCAKETGAVLTCEEHNVIGGLGSAVAEELSKEYPVPMDFVGVNDTFGRSGKAKQVLEYYGLSTENIAQKARELLKKKK